MFYKKSHDSMADYSTSDFPKKNFNFDKAAHKSERSVSRIVVTFLRISDFSAVAVRRPFCFFPIWPLSAAGTFGDFLYVGKDIFYAKKRCPIRILICCGYFLILICLDYMYLLTYIYIIYWYYLVLAPFRQSLVIGASYLIVSLVVVNMIPPNRRKFWRDLQENEKTEDNLINKIWTDFSTQRFELILFNILFFSL